MVDIMPSMYLPCREQSGSLWRTTRDTSELDKTTDAEVLLPIGDRDAACSRSTFCFNVRIGQTDGQPQGKKDGPGPRDWARKQSWTWEKAGEKAIV